MLTKSSWFDLMWVYVIYPTAFRLRVGWVAYVLRMCKYQFRKVTSADLNQASCVWHICLLRGTMSKRHHLNCVGWRANAISLVWHENEISLAYVSRTASFDARLEKSDVRLSGETATSGREAAAGVMDPTKGTASVPRSAWMPGSVDNASPRSRRADRHLRCRVSLVTKTLSSHRDS